MQTLLVIVQCTSVTKKMETKTKTFKKESDVGMLLTASHSVVYKALKQGACRD